MSTVTVRGEEYRVVGSRRVTEHGSKFFGKTRFTLVKVSDGSEWGYLGKRIAPNARLSPRG